MSLLLSFFVLRNSISSSLLTSSYLRALVLQLILVPNSLLVQEVARQVVLLVRRRTVVAVLPRVPPLLDNLLRFLVITLQLLILRLLRLWWHLSPVPSLRLVFFAVRGFDSLLLLGLRMLWCLPSIFPLLWMISWSLLRFLFPLLLFLWCPPHGTLPLCLPQCQI